MNLRFWKKGGSAVDDASQDGVGVRFDRTVFWLGIASGLAAAFAIAFFATLALLFVGMKGGLGKVSGETDSAIGTEQKVPEAADPSAQIIAAAKDAKVDEKKFTKCLEDGTFVDKVDQSAKDGEAAGGDGTPYSIIVGGGKKVPVVGAVPKEDFTKVIDAMLSGGEVSGTKDLTLVPIDAKNDWIRGNKAAKVAIVEYSDLDCPFCARNHETISEILKDYDGKVSWVFRHMPLVSLHPSAPKKAQGAECAGSIGGNDAFWKYIEGMFSAGAE